jgi:hypothetical protein
MECKVVWSIKIVPGGDMCEVNGGVVVRGLVRVSCKAIGFYEPLPDCRFGLLDLVFELGLLLAGERLERLGPEFLLSAGVSLSGASACLFVPLPSLRRGRQVEVGVGFFAVVFLFVEAPTRLRERPLRGGFDFDRARLLLLFLAEVSVDRLSPFLSTAARSCAISRWKDFVAASTLFLINCWSCSGGGAGSESTSMAASSVALTVKRSVSRALRAIARAFSSTMARYVSKGCVRVPIAISLLCRIAACFFVRL